jgi:hypothetical protein
MRLRAAIVVAVVALLLGGCATPLPLPSATPTVASIGLPTVTRLPEACAGVGLVGAVLAGDPHDPRVAWLKTTSGDGRLDIVFPPGFSARFTPHLEIVNAAGQVVASEGDAVNSGCYIDNGGSPLLVLWP